MTKDMKTGRRDFLRQMTAITAAAAMPAVVSYANSPAKVTPRKTKPGKKVKLAAVGIG